MEKYRRVDGVGIALEGPWRSVLKAGMALEQDMLPSLRYELHWFILIDDTASGERVDSEC